MTTQFRPRPYQIDAVEAVLRCLWEEPKESPLIVMPTGTGKSPIITWLCRAILQRAGRVRITVATHVHELVEQNAATMGKVWHDAPYGIYSAGLNIKQAAMPITFCSIQSAVKNIEAFGKQNILIVDEAHLISPEAETMYQKFIAELRKKCPGLIVIGLTATPYRQKQGLLTNGDIFTKIVFDLSGREAFVDLIDDGYLVPLIPKKTGFEFDVSEVKKVGGDYNKAQLQAVTNKNDASLRAIMETLQVAALRDHILVFCSGIDHVEAVTGILQSLGETATCVHSKISKEQRKVALKGFKSGEFRWCVNDGVLTTGFDFPALDCIVLLRPTTSVSLHVQILGRGTRPFYMPGFDLTTREGRLAAIDASPKQNCLVLDFAGNTWRLGPINDPKLPKKKGEGTGEIPIKICPKCGTYNHAAARFCEGENIAGIKCDFEFEFKTKIEQTAATVQLVARDAKQMEWFPIKQVEYKIFEKPFAAPMMRVLYYSNVLRFSEMICIEHTSYAGVLAREWWKKRLPKGAPLPETTAEGVERCGELKTPTHAYVWVNTKFPKVMNVSFNGIPVPVEYPNPGAPVAKEAAE